MTQAYAEIVHPDYSSSYPDWVKWRYVYQGGDAFIDQYLVRLSRRESLVDFRKRKAITYNPAFATAAVNEIRNAVFQRLADVTRTGGSKSYHRVMNGEDGGVDMMNASMMSFMGRELIPELLAMGKVGVWVDNGKIEDGATAASTQGVHPYLYIYKCEDIRSWTYLNGATQGEFESVLLRDREMVYDQNTHLPTGLCETFRHVTLKNGKVHVKFERSPLADGKLVKGPNGELFDAKRQDEVVLNIGRIPLVIFELQHSLLKEAANYQIALMNMASTDVDFCLKANFPFYVEQFDHRQESPHLRPAQQGTKSHLTTGEGIPAGQAKQAGEAKDHEIKVGVMAGRRYGLGLNEPSFIHPSPEPLKVSMEKQMQMKAEIRQLVHLAVTNLDPKMASAESKMLDNRGLENGLAAIGLELEQGDREIAEIWTLYESGSKPATVRYPKLWSMQSDADRREEAKSLAEHIDDVPSKTAQKEIAKMVAEKLLGHRLPHEVLERIYKEIDEAKAITVKADKLLADVEKGLLSPETGSKLRGYDENEWKKAEEAHIRKLEIIAKSQAKGQGIGAARGVPTGATDSSGKDEKELSRAKATPTDPKVRGEGK